MASRFYSEAGRIIMSKPGYDATPGLPDAFKIFDSNWEFSYVIIKSGSATPSGDIVNITFPTQHFRPIVEAKFIEIDDGRDLDRGTSAVVADTTSSASLWAGSNIDRCDYIVYGLSL
jgi:hypothetical protein